MEWLRGSVQHRKGVAVDRHGQQHKLTEVTQGAYHYVIGPYASPVLHVRPGDIVELETQDAFEGKIRTESDKPSEVLDFPHVNPQNGPIYVEGAEKGDVLAVRIDRIRPRGKQPRGTSALIPYFGALSTTAATAMLHDPLPEIVKKFDVTEDGVTFNERITLPYAPFIGTIGTAPELEAISSLVPSDHGGNMDLPDVAPGAILYLPVKCDGGYLYLGDCHAAQGDGELCGVAVEIATSTTVTLDLIKGWPISRPRLETADFIMTVGSARPMEDACRIAYRDLIDWMAADHGFDKYEAYFLLTQAARMRVGNIVDPNYTVGASIERNLLKT